MFLMLGGIVGAFLAGRFSDRVGWVCFTGSGAAIFSCGATLMTT